MERFKFELAQSADTSYLGKIYIEANSKEEATEKVLKMSQYDLDLFAEGWVLSDSINSHGPIEIYDNEGMMLNEF